MRVQIATADQGGCGWYRLRYPAEVLAAQGADVDVSADWQLRIAWDRPWDGAEPPLGVRLVGLAERPDCDVLVVQRPTNWWMPRLIEAVQQAGVAVVVEVDDDYHSIPAGHPGRAFWSPRLHPERNKRHLAEACAAADLVTVTTPALAERYGAHGRVAVLPNCVPGWYLHVDGRRRDPDPRGRTEDAPAVGSRRRGDDRSGSGAGDEDRGPGPDDRVVRGADDGVVIGWPGSPITHVGDLEVMGRAVADVIADTAARFRAIGGSETCGLLGVDGELVEWCDLTSHAGDGYAATVGALDIGVAPLADNAFNRAKSALKLMEFSALGVPCVASPSPDNRRMRHEGCGLLAGSPAEFYAGLRTLIDVPDYRTEVAARSREAMVAWTFERRAHLWWEAWEQALMNRRGTRAA